GKQAFSELFANQLALAPRVEEGNTVILHLFLDVASVELFADDGATALTEIFFPNEDFTQLQLYSNNGTVQLKKATFYPLLSVWQ
ncbi:MAG TPA: GH32 C-terminal domain-containing protein, partial [Saprospiraceae bacterium]|nr:GH32 C-terminal domain-containing protein [Saprospiraceae bacterium]